MARKKKHDDEESSGGEEFTDPQPNGEDAESLIASGFQNLLGEPEPAQEKATPIEPAEKKIVPVPAPLRSKFSNHNKFSKFKYYSLGGRL